MPVFKSPPAMPAILLHRRAPGLRVLLAMGVFLVLFRATAAATEPTTDAINCLSAVLTGANNAVSVKTIDDVPYDLGIGVKGVKNGVEYAFRDASGAPQVIGIYLSSQFKPECPAQGVCMSFNVTWVQTDNHRIAYVCRAARTLPQSMVSARAGGAPVLPTKPIGVARTRQLILSLRSVEGRLGPRCSIDNLKKSIRAPDPLRIARRNLASEVVARHGDGGTA